MSARPKALTIAGSDSGGGAGVQADLKTFCAHGVYGASVLTAVTAQNTVGVRAVHLLEPGLVVDQLDAVLEDIGVDAIKIGMLGNAAIVSAVARRLASVGDHVTIVLDPVMVAKSGDALLGDEAVGALREELLPLATLVTPNLPEAAVLTGLPVESAPERLRAAECLLKMGVAVLLKGGHGNQDTVEDLLVTAAGVERFRHPRQQSRSTHGTGCTLSAAIAARLARGEDLSSAVGGAIRYLQGAIAAAEPIGRGHGPVDHLYRLSEED